MSAISLRGGQLRPLYWQHCSWQCERRHETNQIAYLTRYEQNQLGMQKLFRPSRPHAVGPDEQTSVSKTKPCTKLSTTSRAYKVHKHEYMKIWINSTLGKNRKACMSLHNTQSSDPEDGYISQNMWHSKNKMQFWSITYVTCWLRYQLSMPFVCHLSQMNSLRAFKSTIPLRSILMFSSHLLTCLFPSVSQQQPSFRATSRAIITLRTLSLSQTTLSTKCVIHTFARRMLPNGSYKHI